MQCTKHEDCARNPQVGRDCAAERRAHVPFVRAEADYRGVRLACGHCRRSYSLESPITFTMLRAAMVAFEGDHDDCRPFRHGTVDRPEVDPEPYPAVDVPTVGETNNAEEIPF